jgi:hypothetical protein
VAVLAIAGAITVATSGDTAGIIVVGVSLGAGAWNAAPSALANAVAVEYRSSGRLLSALRITASTAGGKALVAARSGGGSRRMCPSNTSDIAPLKGGVPLIASYATTPNE